MGLAKRWAGGRFRGFGTSFRAVLMDGEQLLEIDGAAAHINSR